MKLWERTFHKPGWKVTSWYGWRTHPITQVKTWHSGVDIATPGSTEADKHWEQYALEEGTVIACGVDSAGNGALFAWVSYPRLGIKVLHYHLHAIMVSRGQKVDENTVIGLTGTTGNSTGVHLHLGVKHLSDNKYFDPNSYNYIPLDESKVVLNGLLDKATIKALQKRLGTLQDGIISEPSMMVKELQRRLLSGEKI